MPKSSQLVPSPISHRVAKLILLGAMVLVASSRARAGSCDETLQGALMQANVCTEVMCSLGVKNGALVSSAEDKLKNQSLANPVKVAAGDGFTHVLSLPRNSASVSAQATSARLESKSDGSRKLIVSVAKGSQTSRQTFEFRENSGSCTLMQMTERPQSANEDIVDYDRDFCDAAEAAFASLGSAAQACADLTSTLASKFEERSNALAAEQKIFRYAASGIARVRNRAASAIASDNQNQFVAAIKQRDACNTSAMNLALHKRQSSILPDLAKMSPETYTKMSTVFRDLKSLEAIGSNQTPSPRGLIRTKQ